MEQAPPLQNAFDSSVAKHVAVVILRHVRPRSRAAAFKLLSVRLSMSLIDQAGRILAIDLYFAAEPTRSAA